MQGLESEARLLGIIAEGVDESPKGFDLRDDGGGRPLQQGTLAGLEFVRQFHAQSFRRETNRCQRVFDLMRQPSRDFGPGSLALRLIEDGHIVEDHDLPIQSPVPGRRQQRGRRVPRIRRTRGDSKRASLISCCHAPRPRPTWARIVATNGARKGAISASKPRLLPCESWPAISPAKSPGRPRI